MSVQPFGPCACSVDDEDWVLVYEPKEDSNLSIYECQSCGKRSNLKEWKEKFRDEFL